MQLHLKDKTLTYYYHTQLLGVSKSCTKTKT